MSELIVGQSYPELQVGIDLSQCQIDNGNLVFMIMRKNLTSKDIEVFRDTTQRRVAFKMIESIPMICVYSDGLGWQVAPCRIGKLNDGTVRMVLILVDSSTGTVCAIQPTKLSSRISCDLQREVDAALASQSTQSYLQRVKKIHQMLSDEDVVKLALGLE